MLNRLPSLRDKYRELTNEELAKRTAELEKEIEEETKKGRAKKTKNNE